MIVQWFTNVETVPLSTKDDETWDTSKQPRGVFVYQDDPPLSFEKEVYADLGLVGRQHPIQVGWKI